MAKQCSTSPRTVANCIKELPAIEKERIASQERVRLAEINSRAAEAEANRRAAAERHQREIKARAALRAEMMDMFKMFQQQQQQQQQ